MSPQKRQFVLRVTQYIFLGCVITLVTQTAHTFAEIPGFHDMVAIDQIDQKAHYEIMMDFIKNGFADYYKTGKRDYFEKSVTERGYRIFVGTSIDEYHEYKGKIFHTLARVSVWRGNGGFLDTEMWCIYQNEYRNYIYEYWLLKQSTYGRNKKNSNKYCEFIITKATSKKDERIIIKKSREFINQYKINDDFSVFFPKEQFQAKMLGQNYIACPKCCEDVRIHDFLDFKKPQP